MLFVIDVGNTNIKLGIFEGNLLKETWKLSTSLRRTSDEYGEMILGLMERKSIMPSDISGAVICSVVPPLLQTFIDISERCFNEMPVVIRAGIKTGINLLVDNPEEVGPDRVANAVATYKLYECPSIVIDLGTAITFDIVSEKGDYLGGAIVPGVNIASEALFTNTAVLPKIELTIPERVIGKNTVSAVQSGLLFGYTELINGMIQRIKREIGEKTTVIATGGQSNLFPELQVDVIDPDMTLKGLKILYDINRGGKW